MAQDKAILWWQDRMRLAIEAKKSIQNSQFLTLDLEKLVLEDREFSYNSLLRLLDINDEPKMKTFFDSEVDVKRANIGRWRNDFRNPEAFKKKFTNLINSDLFNDLEEIGIIPR
jgi:hypothetical protein